LTSKRKIDHLRFTQKFRCPRRRHAKPIGLPFHHDLTAHLRADSLPSGTCRPLLTEFYPNNVRNAIQRLSDTSKNLGDYAFRHSANALSKFSSEMAMQSGEPSIPEALLTAEVSCNGLKSRRPFILLQIDNHPSGSLVCVMYLCLL